MSAIGSGSVQFHALSTCTPKAPGCADNVLAFSPPLISLPLPSSPFCIPHRTRQLRHRKANDVMGILARNPDLDYVNPEKEVYTGLWCLQAGATVFLAARLWTKLTRRHGVWWDDYILITTWVREDRH